MATAAGFDASATSARVKHLRDDDYETYEAGQSSEPKGAHSVT